MFSLPSALCSRWHYVYAYFCVLALGRCWLPTLAHMSCFVSCCCHTF